MEKKGTHSVLLHGSKGKILQFAMACMLTVLLHFGLWAQNSSYNLNNIPIAGTNNSAFGSSALLSNTTGASNVGVGHSALRTNTTGGWNTAVGLNAMYSNTNGNYNTGIGNDALKDMASGVWQTATGASALRSQTSGLLNTANGAGASQYSTTGSYNTALGATTLYSNITGSYNTAVGYAANVGSSALTNATAIGNGATVNASNTMQLGNAAVTAVYVGVGNAASLVAGGLQVTGGSPAAGMILTSQGATGVAAWQAPGNSLWTLTGNAGTVDGVNFLGTTDTRPLNFRVNGFKAGRIDWEGGKANTSFGYLASYSNTTGTTNSAFGYCAQYQNLGGIQNTAVGAQCMRENTSGFSNTAVGTDALRNNTIASANTAVGFRALYQSVDGDANTAIGQHALRNSTNGIANTACGTSALSSNGTGSGNSALGDHADVSTGALSNATAIGSNATVNATNKVRVGSTTVTVIEGQVAFTNPSDARFKSNVTEDDIKGLEFITKLRPVAYNFDTKKFQQFLTRHMPDSVQQVYLKQDFGPSTAVRQSGFLAQEVEQAAKAAGYDFNGLHVPSTEDDNYSLAYSQFVVPLVKAVQEQQAQIEAQGKEIDLQTKQIAAQQQQIIELQQQLLAIDPSKASGTSGVSGIQTAPRLIVAPNPNDGIFTIVTQPASTGTIEIYNLAGVRMYATTLGDAPAQIDLRMAPKGIYTVILLDNGKVLANQMIVMQ